MKPITALLIFATTILVGCSTNLKFSSSNPATFHATRWNGGAVQVSGEIISGTEFRIIAKGAGACSEEQVQEVWDWAAVQLASGKAYSADFKTEPYSYTAPRGNRLYTPQCSHGHWHNCHIRGPLTKSTTLKSRTSSGREWSLARPSPAL